MNNFQSKFTPELPHLLNRLGGSIILTTYQTGKVICISSDGSRLIQLIRDFARPMGISLEGDILAMALQSNITIFKSDARLAKTYTAKPNTYDTLYYPTTTYNTGYVDAHDVVFSNQGLAFVNTAFSCLAKVSDSFSFEPVWRPPFIKKLIAGDACHLNGVCVDEDKNLRYVTAFGATDTPQGWRTNKLTSGILMDIITNEIVASSLAMPHSPRLYKNELYILSSASEELFKIDRKTGQKDVIAGVDGFIRGLSFVDDYAFIGVSKLRKSHTFGDLPIARKRLQAGVVLVNLKTGAKEAELFYEDKLEEIYDVCFIPSKRRVNILNHLLAGQNPALITPFASEWKVQKEQE